MSKSEIERAQRRYDELLKIPCELMTLEQMREFDDLVDMMKQINSKKKGENVK